MQKRKIRLERHTYAPELNNLQWVDSRTLEIIATHKAPGCTDIKSALFPFTRRECAPFRHACIIKRYPAGHPLHTPAGEVVAAGRVATYLELAFMIKRQRAKLAPGGTLDIKIRLIEG